MISKENFELWKEHNVTKLLYRWLDRELGWAESDLSSESLHTPEGLYELKKLSGRKSVLERILTLETEDLTDE